MSKYLRCHNYRRRNHRFAVSLALGRKGWKVLIPGSPAGAAGYVDCLGLLRDRLAAGPRPWMASAMAYESYISTGKTRMASRSLRLQGRRIDDAPDLIEYTSRFAGHENRGQRLPASDHGADGSTRLALQQLGPSAGQKYPVGYAVFIRCAAMLYHLTKLGWTDVVLFERARADLGLDLARRGNTSITPFHTLNADTNMAALQGYTISALQGAGGDLRPVLRPAPRGRPHPGLPPRRLDLSQGRARQASLHGPRDRDRRARGDPRALARSPIPTACSARSTTRSTAISTRRAPPTPTPRRRADAGRRDRPAQPVSWDQPARRRRLGRGDRAGHDRRRARGQRRRAVGARGRRDGRRLPAAAPDGAPVPGDRRHPRGLRARRPSCRTPSTRRARPTCARKAAGW